MKLAVGVLVLPLLGTALIECSAISLPWKRNKTSTVTVTKHGSGGRGETESDALMAAAGRQVAKIAGETKRDIGASSSSWAYTGGVSPPSDEFPDLVSDISGSSGSVVNVGPRSASLVAAFRKPVEKRRLVSDRHTLMYDALIEAFETIEKMRNDITGDVPDVVLKFSAGGVPFHPALMAKNDEVRLRFRGIRYDGVGITFGRPLLMTSDVPGYDLGATPTAGAIGIYRLLESAGFYSHGSSEDHIDYDVNYSLVYTYTNNPSFKYAQWLAQEEQAKQFFNTNSSAVVGTGWFSGLTQPQIDLAFAGMWDFVFKPSSGTVIVTDPVSGRRFKLFDAFDLLKKVAQRNKTDNQLGLKQINTLEMLPEEVVPRTCKGFTLNPLFARLLDAAVWMRAKRQGVELDKVARKHCQDPLIDRQTNLVEKYLKSISKNGVASGVTEGSVLGMYVSEESKLSMLVKPLKGNIKTIDVISNRKGAIPKELVQSRFIEVFFEVGSKIVVSGLPKKCGWLSCKPKVISIVIDVASKFF